MSQEEYPGGIVLRVMASGKWPGRTDARALSGYLKLVWMPETSDAGARSGG